MNGGRAVKLGTLALLCVGLLFGASSPLARAMGTWLSPMAVVSVRFLFALPFAVILWKWRGAKRGPVFGAAMIWFGILFPASVCLYTLSLFYTKISVAIFSFYVANVAASVVIGNLFNRERMTRDKTTALVLTLAAIVVLANPFATLSLDTGLLLGVASGVLQSIASLYQKRLSRTTDVGVLTLAQVVSGLVIASALALFVGNPGYMNLTQGGLALSALFGVAFFLINFFMIYGFKRIEVGTGTLLLSSEIFFGPALAYLVFSESLSGGEIIAGVLAFVAVYFASRSVRE